MNETIEKIEKIVTADNTAYKAYFIHPDATDFAKPDDIVPNGSFK